MKTTTQSTEATPTTNLLAPVRSYMFARNFALRLMVLVGLSLMAVAAATVSSGTKETSAPAPPQTLKLQATTNTSQEATTMRDDFTSSNDSTSESRTSTSVSSSQSVTSHVVSSTVNGQTTTDITVNGNKVEVPASGQLHATINEGNTSTRLDISTDESGSGTSSSINVSVESSDSP